jgi:hypothetical protein
MKKRRLKKSIKKALIILFIYLLGFLIIASMVARAEQINKHYNHNNKIQVNN